MKTTTILFLLSTASFGAAAHPGHAGEQGLAHGLSAELIELLVISATVMLVINVFRLRPMQRLAALRKRPENRK